MTQDTRATLTMILAMAIFAAQDGISRHLADSYNVLFVVMVRYWAFAAFVLVLASRRGGVAKVARSARPLLQVTRGLMLAAEVCIMVAAFTLLGLVESHAIFAIYPLIVTALAVPILGETVGWRRWSAVAIGFAGVLVILQPGSGVFSVEALVPLTSATVFALYSVLTRLASARDSALTSFFWTGIAGAALMTVIGIWFWEPMAPRDWGWMALLCVMALLGHWLLIAAYAGTEASRLQPFSYLQLVFATAIGLLVFGEVLRSNVLWGAAVVVAAGLFTLSRSRRITHPGGPPPPRAR